MRIHQAHIDGYGRFTDTILPFEPGLQVIIGPNERGKSTLRCFITDMLYGQRRGLSTAYEESHDLRVPWQHPGRYGGQLAYTLDDGSQFLVKRCFLDGQSAASVAGGNGGADVSSRFSVLPNGELDFAGAHLGMTKEVFVGAATISHLSLEELGDHEALQRIRERLASLADTGAESGSAEAALHVLGQRLRKIGLDDERGKPLPRARARLVLLDHEYHQALELRRSLARLRGERRELQQEIRRLIAERETTEAALRLVDAHALARQLREAEALKERIDTATKHCFSLSAVREFPLDRLSDLRAAENRMNTAKLEEDRTERELAEARREATDARAELGVTEEAPAEVPAELAQRHETALAEARRARERLEEAGIRITDTEAGLAEAQEALQKMPDFARHAPDPVGWITQLMSSFDVARRTRDEECAERDELSRDLDEKRAAIAERHAIFKDHKDLPELAREHELGGRLREEQQQHNSSQLQTLESRREEAVDQSRSNRLLAAGCFVVVCGLGGWYYYSQRTPMLIPLGVVGVAVLFFTLNFLYFLRRSGALAAEVAALREELAACQEEDEEAPAGIIEELMAQAGCETVRELEAMYEQYRERSAEISAALERFRAQEERAAEAEERMPGLLAHYRETFAKLGETIESEEDVPRAGNGAIARYQSYREAKRRLTDLRTAHDQARSERKEREEACGAAEAALAEADEEVMAFLARQNFDGQLHSDAAAALAAYRARRDDLRDRLTRMSMLEDRLGHLAAKLEEDHAVVVAAEAALDRLLSEAGVSSIAQWHAVAKQAQEYQEVWERRARLESDLAALLDGRDLGDLRAAVAAEAPLPPLPEPRKEELLAKRDGETEQIDAIREQERAIHVLLAERGAGVRSLNDIEEERASVARCAAELELDRESTSYAMALIEDIARDKHARIAPQLAERAGRYLKAITAGAYQDLRIGRDLSVSVPLPKGEGATERPEKYLSKGTVDQIYLALRLALTQCISETGESVPMLLDDPLANYDDKRLRRTVKLLHELGQEGQILLFTCRQDVAKAAEKAGAPIIRL